MLAGLQIDFTYETIKITSTVMSYYLFLFTLTPPLKIDKCRVNSLRVAGWVSSEVSLRQTRDRGIFYRGSFLVFP